MDHWEFDALGTGWTVTTDVPLAPHTRAAVAAELDRVDRYWSRFRATSTVSTMARAAGSYPIAPADQPLIDWYRRLYEATGGTVTPLIGQTIADAGYDAGYSLRPRDTIAAVPAWEDVLTGHTGTLELTRPALLDVGAAGKGFAVDRIADLVGAEQPEFIVDGSGDLVVSPRTAPVRIALEHPRNPALAIGVVELTAGSICASAPGRRAWAERWHHILDPRTAAPTREVIATWAIAPTALIADGLATALFFVNAADLHRALPDVDFHHIVMRRDGTVVASAFPGLELFT